MLKFKYITPLFLLALFTQSYVSTANGFPKICNHKYTIQEPSFPYSGTVSVRNNKKAFDDAKTYIFARYNGTKKIINCTTATRINGFSGIKSFEMKLPKDVNFTTDCYTYGFSSECGGQSTSFASNSFSRNFIQQVDTDLKTIDEIFKFTIKNIIKFAEVSGLVDEAIYLIKVSKIKGLSNEQLTYLSNAEKEIKKISISFHQLTEQELTEQEKRWELIEQIVQANLSVNPISELQLLKLIPAAMNDLMPLGIREEAIKTLLKNELPENIKNEALKYFREQANSPQSDLFIPSLTGLFSLGNESDQKFVVDGILGNDEIRSVASLKALGNVVINFNSEVGKSKETQLITQLEKIINNQNLHLSIKEIAVQSLGNFATQNKSKTANNLLVKTVREKSDLQVTTLQSIPLTRLNNNQIRQVLNIQRTMILPN